MPRTMKAVIPQPLRWSIWERDNFTCRYCGSRRNLSLDHVIPESRGGPLIPENLITACRPCNSSKGDRDLGTYLRQLDTTGSATMYSVASVDGLDAERAVSEKQSRALKLNYDASRLLGAIKANPGGMTRTAISHFFLRHRTRAQLDQLVGDLKEWGFIDSKTERTDGRSITYWFALPSDD